MQTITLSSILQKWEAALLASSAIQDFCMEKYNKAPTLYVGYDKKRPATTADCPVIILFTGNKDEGLEQDIFTYRASIGWSVANKNKDTSTPGVIRYPGVFESDELGQLIWAVIAEASDNWPVSRAYYDLEAVEFFPQVPGRMDIEIDVIPPIGAPIEY